MPLGVHFQDAGMRTFGRAHDDRSEGRRLGVIQRGRRFTEAGQPASNAGTAQGAGSKRRAEGRRGRGRPPEIGPSEGLTYGTIRDRTRRTATIDPRTPGSIRGQVVICGRRKEGAGVTDKTQHNARKTLPSMPFRTNSRMVEGIPLISLRHQTFRCGVLADCPPPGRSADRVVTEEVRTLDLEDLEHRHGDLADLGVGRLIASGLDEVSQGPSVGGHENLGLGRVGQDRPRGLAGLLAAERLVLEIRELPAISPSANRA